MPKKTARKQADRKQADQKKTEKQKYSVLARTSAASILKNTGKTWDEWVPLLEKSGARHWQYREINEFLKKKYRLSTWWQSIVTQGYETAIGKRVEGRNQKGLYTVTVTGSLPMSALKLWKFMTSEEGTFIWLKPLTPVAFLAQNTFEAEGGVFGEIRTIKAPERMRLRWQEAEWAKPSVVQIYILARPKEKAAIAITHEGLKDARLKENMRSHWRMVISDLKEALK